MVVRWPSPKTDGAPSTRLATWTKLDIEPRLAASEREFDSSEHESGLLRYAIQDSLQLHLRPVVEGWSSRQTPLYTPAAGASTPT
jgi:hypothetical protein